MKKWTWLSDSGTRDLPLRSCLRCLNPGLEFCQLGLNRLDAAFESGQGTHVSFHERPDRQAFHQALCLLDRFHVQDQHQLDRCDYRASRNQLPFGLPLPAHLEGGQGVSLNEQDTVLRVCGSHRAGELHFDEVAHTSLICSGVVKLGGIGGNSSKCLVTASGLSSGKKCPPRLTETVLTPGIRL